MNTLHWLWGCVLNKPIQWIDMDGNVCETEHVTRLHRFHILRPKWTYYALSTRQRCGCRRRLGLWKIIYCSGCAFGEDWA